MATISNIAANSAANKSPANNSSAARIADNFDQFLQLLTTQLKNQNPLDPLDTNQFTQQLVQFASVEQQIKTNDNLTSLLASNKTASVTSAMGFVGAQVTADGTKSALKEGEAKWRLNAPRAGNATITIKDKNNSEVYSVERVVTAGDQSFTWDGTTNGGQKAADGEYSIVIAAKDGSGQVMNVKSEISGIVDGVDVSGDSPILQIGGISLPVSSVKSIRR
jgi:flagellar basal-body rod modification protein FlgD